jgi:WD40 repeat protein
LAAPAFLPDGEILLAGSTGPMTVWEPTGTSRLQDLVPGYPGGLSPTPDPHILVGADLGRSYTLLDADTLQPLGPPTVVGATDGTSSTLVVFDPSGKRLAAVGPSGAVTIRAFPGGQLLRTAQIPLLSHFAAWRPDGRQIAFGAFNGGITLVDPDTGNVRNVPRTGTSLVSWPSYRPNGRELWVADLSGNNAVITSLDEATPRASRVERFGLALRFAFTADGHSLVAMRPGQVQVYDAATLAPRAAAITLKTGYLLMLSTDGRSATINDLSNHVRLIDLDAGRPIGPPLPIGALSASWLTHDGKALLTSSPNGGARWSIDPRRWREEACALAGRNLTEAEWRRYLPNAGQRHATCPDNPLP